MDSDLKKKFYREMLRIRRFEETVRDLFAEGKLPGFYHLYIGEEAIAVGACGALEKSDYISSTHRGHGHVLAKGARMDKMMAELYGKITGYNKGKGGSLHITSPEDGVLGANGIVGGGIPIATGAALTAKLKGNRRVAISFFGEGASNEGTFHEAINLASAYDLPCVYICENNLYGVGTRQSRVRKVEDIADRAQGYDIPGVIVDGNDVEEVYQAVNKAVEDARAGKGPTLIECKTYRWRTHFEGEPDTYRTSKEVKEWKERCPIKNYEKRLLDFNIMTGQEIKEIQEGVEEEIKEAINYAEESPVPGLSTALEDLYC